MAFKVYKDWFVRALQMRHSKNATERNRLWLARLKSNLAPFLLDRLARGHVAIEGGTSAGKTSRILAPFIEQHLSFGDVSLFIIDGKADTMEMHESAVAGAALGSEPGRIIPFKHFTPMSGRSTHLFNAFAQNSWRLMNASQRSDYLCAMLGLQFGRGYGASWFSDSDNFAAGHTMLKYPNFQSVRELNMFVRHELASRSRSGLSEAIRQAAAHLEAALFRLEHLEAVNATAETHPAAAIAAQINFMDMFLIPQVHVLHLPSALGPELSGILGRMYLYGVLSAAAVLGSQRKVRLIGIIDEAPQFLSKNLEYVLRTARSMDIDLVLSYQSRKDLISTDTDLASVLETNTRLRWWPMVSDIDVIKRLSELSGTMIGKTRTTSKIYSHPWGGLQSESITEQETILPRLSTNDLLRISDDPDLAVLQLTRGEGFAQFGGFPVVVRTAFHITQEEYERRQRAPWPEPTAATIVARHQAEIVVESSPPPAPIVLESLPPTKKPKRNFPFPKAPGA